MLPELIQHGTDRAEMLLCFLPPPSSATRGQWDKQPNVALMGQAGSAP